MHVNNETGVRQPIEDIGAVLKDHDAYFHVDAAQGFGKDLNALRCQRIDLISISSHKVYGPVGVGALAIRRRGFKKPPLVPAFLWRRAGTRAEAGYGTRASDHRLRPGG